MTSPRVLTALAVSISALCSLQLGANQAGPGSRPAQVPPSPTLFAPDIVAVLAFAEGPTWAADGSLFFSDIANQRIMRVLPGGDVTTFRTKSNVANGLLIDRDGRLVACEGAPFERPGMKFSGTPRVTRTDLTTGEVEILAASGQGVTLVAPNDLTMDGRGTVYFTDLTGNGVYRIDGPGKVTQMLNASTVNRPNGIQISPDDATLYLVEAGVGDEPRRLVRRYQIGTDGRLRRLDILHGFYTADGMSIDVQGNLYVSGGKDHDARTGLASRVGVFVIAPDGAEKAFYPVRATFSANNGFGGADMKTLFITGGDTIYKVRTDIPGLLR